MRIKITVDISPTRFAIANFYPVYKKLCTPPKPLEGHGLVYKPPFKIKILPPSNEEHEYTTGFLKRSYP